MRVGQWVGVGVCALVVAGLPAGPAQAREFSFPVLDSEATGAPTRVEPARYLLNDTTFDLVAATNEVTGFAGSTDGVALSGNSFALWTAASDLATGNLNQLGSGQEAVVSFGSPGTATVLTRSGANFSSIATLAPAEGVRTVAVADFDGDGDNDIATAAAGTTRLHLNDGTGTAYSSTITASFGSTASHDLAVGDLDEDGRADLVVAEVSGPNAVLAVYTLKSGSLVRRGTLSAAGQFLEVDVADVDGDGHLDWLARAASGWVYLSLGDGTGSSSALTIPLAGAAAVATADLDGDGDTDVALSRSTGPHAIETYENTGSGGLVLRGSASTIEPATDLDAVRLTGDRSPELVYGTSTGFVVLRNAPVVKAPSGEMGSVTTGQAGPAQTLTFRNVGGAPLHTTGHSLTGNADFTVADRSCVNQTVEPGETCTFSARFAPVSDGLRQATLTLNHPYGQTTVVPLTGKGEAPNAGPEGPAGPAGPAGTDGADGTDGTNGADGADGTNGTNGTNGADGAPGAPGPAGPPGATGPAGPAALVKCRAPKRIKRGKRKVRIRCKVSYATASTARLRRKGATVARKRVGRKGRVRITRRLRPGRYVLAVGGARVKLRVR